MNRNNAISNGTLFGVWPLNRGILAFGVVLILFLALVEPEASRGLGFFQRLTFWTLHIGVALGALYFVSLFIMPRVIAYLPTWPALLVAGFAGMLIIVPISFWLENSSPGWLMPVERANWVSDLEQSGGWNGLLAEFIQSAPEIMIVWLFINMPFLRSRPELDPSKEGGRDRAGHEEIAEAEAEQYKHQMRDEFLAGLPRSIGTDVLAVSSDLHYLHVYTEKGHCMILGSLQRAADALGEDGIRVHRAHWVARKAVVKIVKDGTQWYCALSNGLKIPVSRRNKALVADWFGHNAKVLPIRTSKRASK